MNVAITGATGSLGTALLTRLLADRAERIVAISRDEQKQEAREQELGGSDAGIRWFLGDVRDKDRMITAFRGCEAVIHCAALKRVDRIAYNPIEVLRTNVDGTVNVIEAATEASVPRVLLISTDKACQAENIYGGTKFLAEQLAISHNAYSYPRGTRVSAVRYGNVWGSRGSVMEVWAESRRRDPLRLLDLTHPGMTRFVITLDEAVRLVLRCLTRMRGGEIFIPLLPSMRLADLAAAFDAEYRLTGFRPGGEKLSERLLNDEEPSRTLLDQGVYIVTPSLRSWSSQPYPGDPISRTTKYDSATNPWMLSVDELRQRLKEG